MGHKRYLWFAGHEGMEKKMKTTIGFRLYGGNEGMQTKMKTAIMGYIGTTIEIHSFIPS